MLTDTPARSEPKKKIALVSSRIGFLPKMSETLPQMGVAADWAIRYAEPIQVYPDALLSSSAMVGNAVVTMVMSRATSRTATAKENMMRRICNFVRCGRSSSGAGAGGGGPVPSAGAWLSSCVC